MSTRKLLGYIVGIGMENASELKSKRSELQLRFNIRYRNPQQKALDQLIEDVINWENGGQHASLEKTLSEKYVIEATRTHECAGCGEIIGESWEVCYGCFEKRKHGIQKL